jgi:predicted nucleic acid-binding protein
VLPEFQDRTLPVDTAVARRCAQLHAPDPKPERDTLIAATALVHGLTVVTRNVDDFSATGIRLVNPWEARVNRNHHETTAPERGHIFRPPPDSKT